MDAGEIATYAPRPVRFLELWQIGEWRLKAYSIAYGREVARPELIAAAKAVAQQRLELSAAASLNYRVGFVGVHDGRTANFVFVDWWAEQNELRHHVYISPSAEPTALEYRTPSGIAACVWDLALIAFERNAWVETAMTHGLGAAEAYLTRRLNGLV